jgi:hypothetical protein
MVWLLISFIELKYLHITSRINIFIELTLFHINSHTEGKFEGSLKGKFYLSYVLFLKVLYLMFYLWEFYLLCFINPKYIDFLWEFTLPILRLLGSSFSIILVFFWYWIFRIELSLHHIADDPKIDPKIPNQN